MTALARDTSRPRPPSPMRGTTRAVAGLTGSVVVAAILGYAVHHVGPLRDHALESTIAGVTLVVVAAATPGIVAIRRRELDIVIVARPGEADVRPATAADARFSAAVHRLTLDHGFFTKLGPAFLRTYHRSFRESPHAIALVGTLGGTPVGFLVGTLRPRSHSRWLLSHRGARLGVLGAVALLVRPLAAIRFLRTRVRRYVGGWKRHRVSAPAAAPPQGHAEAAVLSHVAVVPGAEGSGLGRRLVEAFVEACRVEGIERVTLMSLEELDRARGFYAHLGWEPGPLHTTTDGRAMREWSLRLRS